MNLRGVTPIFYTQDGTVCREIPGWRMLSLSLSSSMRGGYKTARMRLAGNALDILQAYYLLGQWMPVYGPDGYRCWDGIVYELHFSNGMSYDLGDISNAVNVIYSSDIGVRNSVGFTTDTTSIARYGRKELVQNAGGLTAGTAADFRDQLLYQHLHSLSVEPFKAPAPAASGALECELVAYGWYATLGWERWVQTAEGQTDTGTQIYNIVASSSFITASTTYIGTTSVTTSQYRPDQNMTLLQEVERLAALRDSSNYSLWFQVWNDRVGELNRWAGGNFPALDYYMDRRGIYDVDGAEVPLWHVRADRVLQTPQYMPLGYGVFSDALDTPQTLYLSDVELAVTPSDMVLSVKPMGWRDFAQLIRSY